MHALAAPWPNVNDQAMSDSDSEADHDSEAERILRSERATAPASDTEAPAEAQRTKKRKRDKQADVLFTATGMCKKRKLVPPSGRLGPTSLLDGFRWSLKLIISNTCDVTAFRINKYNPWLFSHLLLISCLSVRWASRFLTDIANDLGPKMLMTRLTGATVKISTSFSGTGCAEVASTMISSAANDWLAKHGARHEFSKLLHTSATEWNAQCRGVLLKNFDHGCVFDDINLSADQWMTEAEGRGSRDST